MSLSPADIRKIKDAFNEAAKGPYADQPAMGIGGRKLTVRDVANEVENETPVGKFFLMALDKMISSGAATVDDVVAKIKNPPAPPAP